MIDWRQYWEEFPSRFGDDDFRRQVGRTANGGRPTPEPELELVVDEVISLLQLSDDDVLADLCCGNGLLTARFAERCAMAVGIDFSATMIRIANTHHGRRNVRYVEGSVLDLRAPENVRFDKVCMIESLAYFAPGQLTQILKGVTRTSTDSVELLFSGVLDESRKWHFFDTPERKASYELQKKQGKEIMGRWWTRDEIGRIANQCGYRCDISDQDARLSTAHYRFNVVMCRG